MEPNVQGVTHVAQPVSNTVSQTAFPTYISNLKHSSNLNKDFVLADIKANI